MESSRTKRFKAPYSTRCNLTFIWSWLMPGRPINGVRIRWRAICSVAVGVCRCRYWSQRLRSIPAQIGSMLLLVFPKIIGTYFPPANTLYCRQLLSHLTSLASPCTSMLMTICCTVTWVTSEIAHNNWRIFEEEKSFNYAKYDKQRRIAISLYKELFNRTLSGSTGNGHWPRCFLAT